MARVGLVFAALSLASIAASAAGAQPRTIREPIDPDRVLVNRIRADFALSNEAAIETTVRSVGDVRRLIGDRVDRRLLSGALELRGRDYSFVGADGRRRQIGLLAVRYPMWTVPLSRARVVATRRYFNRTKILTPIVAVAVNAEVVILYTETARDLCLIALMNGVAARLQPGVRVRITPR